eukprot:6179540-Pleurochrysis_carterae.AAC.1
MGRKERDGELAHSAEDKNRARLVRSFQGVDKRLKRSQQRGAGGSGAPDEIEGQLYGSERCRRGRVEK